MTTQLAFSRGPLTELHSAPNDGRDSNHPNRLRLLCKAGTAHGVLKSYHKYLHSRCLRWSGGEKHHRLFSSSNTSPHISQKRDPSSSSFLEAGSEVLLQAEQKKKEGRAEPALGEHCKPHSTAGAAGGGVCICFATPWKAGWETKSPVSWHSY